METLRSIFFKPDPQAQQRKVNALMRSNIRKLDRDIRSVKLVETKTETLIKQASQRGQRDPARAEGALKEARSFAQELVRTRKMSSRLLTARAQLASVQMQVGEAFATRRMEGSIRASVGIMRNVNQLIRLPDMTITMREIGVELMKAGVIEEMVEDSMPMDSGLLEDEDAAEGEVDKVLAEILKDRTDKTKAAEAATASGAKRPGMAEPATANAPEEAQLENDDEEEEDAEAMMNQMRSRLEALRS